MFLELRIFFLEGFFSESSPTRSDGFISTETASSALIKNQTLIKKSDTDKKSTRAAQRSSGTLRYMRLGCGKIPTGFPVSDRASLGTVFFLRNSTIMTGNDSIIVKIFIIVEDARS